MSNVVPSREDHLYEAFKDARQIAHDLDKLINQIGSAPAAEAQIQYNVQMLHQRLTWAGVV